MKSIFYCFLLGMTFWACNQEAADQRSGLVASSVELESSNETPVNIGEYDCFQEIFIELQDSVLLYWAEIADDSSLLSNHAGNRRIMITKNADFYYSRNSGGIKNLDNYFNRELSFYKNLSAENMQTLKDSMYLWKLGSRPGILENPNVEVSGGTCKYFYWNDEEMNACIKIMEGVDLGVQIEQLLKSVQ